MSEVIVVAFAFVVSVACVAIGYLAQGGDGGCLADTHPKSQVALLVVFFVSACIWMGSACMGAAKLIKFLLLRM